MDEAWVMCKRHMVSLLLVFLAPVGRPEGVTGQDLVRAHTWEVGVVGAYGLTGGRSFGDGTGAVVTGFLAYQLIPSIEVRAGVSLTAVKDPWDANEYLSVFVGSAYSSGSGVPGLTPFIGGRMLLVSDLGDEYGVGWGIGGMPGVRWQLGGIVGLEVAFDVQWVQLRHERFSRLAPIDHQPLIVDWRSGYSVTFGVGCVLGV